MSKYSVAKTIEISYKTDGLSPVLHDMPITFDPSLSRDKLITKTVRTLKRAMKKNTMTFDTAEAKIEYLNSFTTDQDNVNIRFDLVDEEKGRMEYLKKLLLNCLPKKEKAVYEMPDSTSVSYDYSKIILVKITFTTPTNSMEGYGVVDSTLDAKKHLGHYQLLNNNIYNGARVIDIYTLAASALLYSSMHGFCKKHFRIYQSECLKFLRENGADIPLYVTYGKDDYTELLQESDIGSCVHKRYNNAFLLKEDYSSEKRSYWVDPTSDIQLTVIIHMFVAHIMSTKTRLQEHIDAQKKSYAKAFETKKHINLSHQVVMQNNKFLNYYGYVELDNNVDLNKFAKLEDSLEELAKVIPIPRCKHHSFRIKKLGKHRAAGVYFPSKQSTIHDIQRSDSFTHELFHQIDYQLGENGLLSRYSDTKHCIELILRYSNAVMNAIKSAPADHPLLKEWYSTGKFNQAYYFMPTEIFARCGEIYVMNKLSDSLLVRSKEDPSIVHPQDKDLVDYINHFFDNLFREKFTEKQPAILEPKVEQLSLF